MMNNKPLSRSDLVGKRLVSVLQSEWQVDQDGYGSCDVVVLLEDDISFFLPSHDPFVEFPLLRADSDSFIGFQIASSELLSICKGKIVTEILTSDYWPTPGLLLNQDTFLYCSDDFTPRLVGPCALAVGERYDLNDVATFWGHHLLAETLR
jgi:hypothetical protein